MLPYDYIHQKSSFQIITSLTDYSKIESENGIVFKLKDGTSFPTVKSLKLCNRIIKSSSNERDLVYIPFAGSGSEIISCINNNRNYLATEINKKYIDEIIIPRIENNI